MKKLLITLILLTTSNLSFALDFPQTIKNETELKISNYDVSKTEKGDLNKDEKDDLLIVLQKKSAPDIENFERVLLIYFKTDDSTYKKAVQNNQIIMNSMDGGILGDPFIEAKIQNGTFYIKHYGGSRERWGFTHRFRFQNNDFYLIGYTDLSEDSALEKSTDIDINMLTGDYIITYKNKNQQTQKKGKKSYPQLPKLSDWSGSYRPHIEMP